MGFLQQNSIDQQLTDDIPAVDGDVLEKLLAFDQAKTGFVFELVQRFIQEAPKTLGRIQGFYKNDDILSMQREAHTLKSTAGNIGAQRVHVVSEAIEYDQCRDLKLLEQELNLACTHLAPFLAQRRTL